MAQSGLCSEPTACGSRRRFQVKQVFQQHAEAFRRTQAADGRWHQLMNDTKSFLETSTTAMAITSMIRGVRGGVLAKADYDPVIKRAWKGLLSTILPNGTVTQVRNF